ARVDSIGKEHNVLRLVQRRCDKTFALKRRVNGICVCLKFQAAVLPLVRDDGKGQSGWLRWQIMKGGNTSFYHGTARSQRQWDDCHYQIPLHGSPQMSTAGRQVRPKARA